MAAPAWFHTDFGDGGQSAIDRTNSNIMYHTYFNQSNNFFGPAISTTGGGNGPGNWSDAIGFAGPVACGNGMDITDQVSFYAPLALMRPDVGGVRDIIYFGSDTLYRNANPGPVLDDGMGGCIAPNAWTAVSADLVNGFLSAIATHDVRQGGNEVVYAAASTGAIFTVPTGVAASAACPGAGCPTWVTISAAPLPARFVTDLYVDPTDATGNTVYAAFSGFNGATPGHVFKTTNGRNGAAATWANVSGNLPDAPVNAITLDHPFNFFAPCADEAQSIGTRTPPAPNLIVDGRTLRMNTNDGSALGTLILLDGMGRVARTITTTASTAFSDLSAFASGAYIVRSLDADKAWPAQRFILN